MSRLLAFLLVLLTVINISNAYWLMGAKNILTIERLDPIVNPGKVSGHVHTILGGSAFSFNTSTDSLRNSQCTSIPITQDKSNYWFPHLYFQWANGSFTSLTGGAVMYYLFSDKPGTTTAFPDNFRMLSGDPTLRQYDATSPAQRAITFLCLDFNGVSTRHNELPAKSCPSGIRAQINFPSCWDGKNIDSPSHKSHVAFLSGGPDSGTCSDPNFPVTLPRIFIEMYWGSNSFDAVRSKAMNPNQPFVYSYGDATGYGYHADFINGWDSGVLQRAVDNCHCNIYGDPTCCANAGIFTLDSSKECHITKAVDEVVEGTLSKLPGNNPVQGGAMHVPMLTSSETPGIIAPVCTYTGSTPPATCGTVVTPAASGSSSSSSSVSSSPAASPPAKNILPVLTTPSSSTSTSSTATPSSNLGLKGVPAGDKGHSSSSSSTHTPSPTPSSPHAGPASPAPDNSTGSDDDDDDSCSGKKRKSRKNKRDHWHARAVRRHFDNTF